MVPANTLTLEIYRRIKANGVHGGGGPKTVAEKETLTRR
jgi:hypothetical protein